METKEARYSKIEKELFDRYTAISEPDGYSATIKFQEPIPVLITHEFSDEEPDIEFDSQYEGLEFYGDDSDLGIDDFAQPYSANDIEEDKDLVGEINEDRDYDDEVEKDEVFGFYTYRDRIFLNTCGGWDISLYDLDLESAKKVIKAMQEGKIVEPEEEN